jgi:hypothetical protein
MMAGPNLTASVLQPATGGFSVTPADSDLSAPTRAVWVGTQGDLRVTLVSGGDVVLKNAFGLLPISVKRIWSTNTTASNIVGLS